MRLFFLILALLWTSPVWGENSVPVKITADTMRYTQKNDEVIFAGNVHVIREDINLWSETLTVFLEKQKNTDQAKDPLAAQQGSIKRITAIGNVRIKAEGNRSGTCGKATYEAASEVLILEDNPVLKEGPNTIQGEIIKLYIKENRSEVIGGKKRVEAIFMTQDKQPGQIQ
ncbi:MAG: hypothetical protein EOL86_07580 [Deltaproteobacteria bacterium]|nr:hypothetical protein [Deltaproteobacteria bacterium]